MQKNNFLYACEALFKRFQHFTEQRTTLLAFALPCSVLLCSGSSNEYNISPSSVQLRLPLLCLARCCSARGRQTNTTFHRAAYNFACLCSALLGAALLGVVKRIQHFTEQRTTSLAFALPCSVLLCSGSSNEYNISPSSVQLCLPLLCLARCCSARGRQTNTTFHRAAYNFACLCSALLGAALLGVVKRIQHSVQHF